MTDNNKKCILCGKQIEDENRFCDDCKNHIENQYKTDFLDEEDQIEGLDPLEDYAINTPEDEEMSSDTFAIEEGEQLPPKKLMSKRIKFLLIICILLVLGGGAFYGYQEFEKRKLREKEDLFWSQCVQKNTPEQYSQYLLTFQNGRYIDEANTRIREFRLAEVQAWETLRKSADINDFYAFLSEQPNTPYIHQIRSLMDSLSWITTLQTNTPEAYMAYLDNVQLGNLSGNYVGLAQEKHTYLSQIKPIEGTSLDSLKVDLESIFATLSANDPKLLLKMFAPRVFYYNKDSMISSTDVVAKIENNENDKDIKELDYKPLMETIIAKRDNEGIAFIDLIVDREVTYNKPVKVGKNTEVLKEILTDTFRIELDRNKQVQAIESIQKKAKVTPK